jgi:hypothetical protein
MRLQGTKPRIVRGLVGLPLLFVSAVTLIAQSEDKFTPTGSMNVTRTQHTATLLPDGRVLIAGGAIGWDYGPTTATAELYDPGTGIFTPTGSMTSARSNHTATLLADGRVLMVGGGPPGTAELYDPSAGVFTATGNLPPRDTDGPAMLLNDGRVLIVGAYTADLYDPSSGTFTSAGPRLSSGTRRPVLLPDGNVLLMATPGFQGLAIEFYNPRTNTFSVPSKWPFVTYFFNGDPDTPVPVGYTAGSANLLRSGAVLVTLQDLDGGDSSWAVLYDPSTGTFAQTAVAFSERNGQSGTSLSDARVLITGGVGKQCGSVGTPLPYAGVYDPAVDGFYGVRMTTYRDSYTATLLRNGQVLIAGGMGCPILANGKYSPLASAELYVPAAVAPPPALLSLSGDGRGPGAVQHAATYQVVSTGNPAAAGEILTIYSTGLLEGSVIPPQVSIGGKMAEVLWFGDTPDYAGLNQINVRVPNGIAPGPDVPMRMTYIERPSNEVTVGVR